MMDRDYYELHVSRSDGALKSGLKKLSVRAARRLSFIVDKSLLGIVSLC